MVDLVHIRGVSAEPPDSIRTLQQVLNEGGKRIFDIAPNLIAETIDGRKWVGRLDSAGKEFASFEDFAARPLWDGLGCSINDLKAICRKREDVCRRIDDVMTRGNTHREAGAKGGRGHKAIDNVKSFNGNSPTYALKRLKRDRPDLAERVINGELSANAAAIEAGFRRKPTPYEIVLKHLPKLTDDERHKLRAML